jgi:hypothetical protein
MPTVHPEGLVVYMTVLEVLRREILEGDLSIGMYTVEISAG